MTKDFVQFSLLTKQAIDRAKEIIAELVREAKVGEIYDAKVVRIESFGAFVKSIL